MNKDLINVLLAVVNILAGWWLKAIRDSLADLRNADKSLADKVGSIEVLVVGNYVKRDDFDRFTEAVFKKLDKIHDKLYDRHESREDKT